MRDLALNLARTTISAGLSPSSMAIPLASNVFAQSLLNGVQVGQFTVQIDSELIVCQQSTTANTLTVLQRGAEGTTAASHASGSYVQQFLTAGLFNHLWANVPDRFNPNVPYNATLGINPSAIDDEMEYNSTATNYVLYPVDNGAALDVSSWSYLVFNRQGNSTSTYYLYRNVNFASIAPPFTVTTALHVGTNATISTYGANSLTPQSLWFFLCDQTNPTALFGGGDRVLVGLVNDPNYAIQTTTGNQAYNGNPLTPTSWFVPTIQAQVAVNSVLPATPSVILADPGVRYLRIKVDASSNATISVSLEGIAWHLILASTPCQITSLKSLGWIFLANNPYQNYQSAAIDFVRLTVP